MRSALVVSAILAATFLAASHLGKSVEVVILTTHDRSGIAYQTRLWILDDGSTLWLRAATSGCIWYERLLSDPHVRVERNGRARAFVAEPDQSPRITARVNFLMREKYGWADWIFRGVQLGFTPIPIRLEATAPPV